MAAASRSCISRNAGASRANSHGATSHEAAFSANRLRTSTRRAELGVLVFGSYRSPFATQLTSRIPPGPSRDTASVGFVAPKPENTDLIPDEEIADKKLDAFHHGHFVDRLLATIKDTTTPSRIALFASWGAGKTSISRLLEPRVKTAGYEFAHFDAFKYAREPLLREFIVSLARQTRGETEAERLRSELYEAQSNVRFRADLDRRLGDIAAAFKRLGERLTGTLVICALIVLFIVAVLVDRDVFEVAALASVGLAVVFALLAIAQATGMLSIVGDSLRLTVSRERPDSPEQFEQVARGFIQDTLKIKGDEKKLVVFVDELDRVDASEVVGTLETLKTFLGLPGCVFVVAADRRVIEKAIAQRARQETPVVLTDPYYSSASSYLDKIFQHQLELPEVIPGRLSRFARDLALKHGGVWKQLRDHKPGTLDDVVSVLIPIHVANPRRVKILMNAYVHAYHLAQARSDIGYLGTDAIDRATEIAKLVVLRSEFPGFAEELLDDPDLTTDIPIWREGLASDDEEGSDDATSEQEGAGDAEIDEARAQEIEDALSRPLSVVISRDEKEDDLDELIGPAKERLCRYLEQTRVVEGPAEDLLRLESLGSPYELSDRTATALRDAAYGNAPETAREIIDGLEAESERLGAIRLLATLMRTGIGIDADNALAVLLAVAQSSALSLEQVAHEIAPALRAHIGHRGLPSPDYLGGVLKIGAAAGSKDLVRRALEHDDALGSTPLRDTALALADSLGPDYTETLARIVAVEEMANPDAAAQAVGGMRGDLAEGLVRDAAGLTARVLEEEILDDVERALGERDAASRLAGVTRFVDRLPSQALIEAGLMALAESANPDAQSTLSHLLEDSDAIGRSELADSVLRTCAGRPYTEIVQRLPTLAASPVSADARERYVPRVVLSHWRALDDGTETAESVETVGTALVRLSEGLELAFSDEDLSEFIDPLSAQPSGEAAVNELRLRHENALRIVDLGVTSIKPAAFDRPLRAVLDAVGTRTLAARNELAASLHRLAIDLIGGASTEAVRSVLEQENHLPLAAHQAVGLRLRAGAELLERGDSIDAPVSREEVQAAAQEVDDDYLESLWIRAFEDSPDEVPGFVARWSEGTPSERLQGAVERFIERTEVAPDRLIRAVLNKLEEWPTVAFLNSLGTPLLRNGPLLDLIDDVAEGRTAASGDHGFDVWEAAAPQSTDDRKTLILDFLLPFTQESGAAFDVAIERCPVLCIDPPHGTKDALKTGLLTAAKQGRDAEQTRRSKKAAEVLIELGLMEEPKKGLGHWVRKRLRLD